MKQKLIPKFQNPSKNKLTVQGAHKQSTIDWKKIENAVNEYSEKKYKLHADTLDYVDQRLKEENIPELIRNAVLGNIVMESQGRPSIKSGTGGGIGTYYGLLQWDKDRLPKRVTGQSALDQQIDSIVSHLNKAYSPHWSDGGTGTGIQNIKEALDITWGRSNKQMPKDKGLANTQQNRTTWGFTQGYVRPLNKQQELDWRSFAANTIKQNRNKDLVINNQSISNEKSQTD